MTVQNNRERGKTMTKNTKTNIVMTAREAMLVDLKRLQEKSSARKVRVGKK